jgi:phosphatidate cytidylyltransferase
VNVDLAEPANKSLRYRELFPGSAFMTPLLRRVLTAVLLLAVFVPAVIWAPAWLWGILMAGVVGMAAREWAHLSHFPALPARLYSALLTLCALVLPTLLNTGWPIFQSALILLAIAFWLVVAPLWLLGRWHAEQPFVRAAVGVMAIVWIADTAAYFAGRYFGRHKLAPSISPGKTREGVAGAFVALALYAVVLSVTLKLPMVPLLFAMTGLLYLSVLGDLFESWIKRVSGMKDSGHLLPGHGGVLDRIDALTSTLPMAAALLMWLVYTA